MLYLELDYYPNNYKLNISYKRIIILLYCQYNNNNNNNLFLESLLKFSLEGKSLKPWKMHISRKEFFPFFSLSYHLVWSWSRGMEPSISI